MCPVNGEEEKGPEVRFVRVPRSSDLFKNRVILVMFEDGGGAEIPVPDGVVLCDSCGLEITEDEVTLMCIDGEVWGALCSKCEKEIKEREEHEKGGQLPHRGCAG